jgi:hypothetical protein
MFRSLKPALGHGYLTEWAADHARAGLPLPSAYKVPGLRYSRGKRDLTQNQLSGVSRREVIKAYRAAWVGKYGDDLKIPHSDFLARFDPDYGMPREGPARRRGREFRVPQAAKLPPPVKLSPPTGLQGLLAVYRGDRLAGMVRMLRNGVGIWMPDAGPLVYLHEPTLRGVVQLDDQAHGDVESWIAERRKGPEWAAYVRALGEFDRLNAAWVAYDARVARSVEVAARKLERLRRAAARSGLDPRAVPLVPVRQFKPPAVRRPVAPVAPVVAEWQSPRDRFEAFEDRRCARIAALSGSIGHRVKAGHSWEAGITPLTGMARKLRLQGYVSNDGKPVRREYRAPADLQQLIEKDDFWLNEPPPAARVVFHEMGPRYMRRAA